MPRRPRRAGRTPPGSTRSPRGAAAPPPERRPVAGPPLWWLLPILLAVVAAAYQPVWHGGLLWDDDAHLTRPALQSVEGLWRIWTDLGATQQYYPLAHTAFWIQHRLWGDSVTGYHLVNIALHACSAWLLAVILFRLAVPGAILAAVVFALHPVHVESVAWMSELKNTLSVVLCLASAAAYLRFDDTRSARHYVAALACFVLGLLAKTVVATLPVALVIIFWWRRGRVDPRRDVRPLVPFLALGAAAGLLTAWVERTYIGAQGPGFEMGLLDRVLVAGRAFWFYLGKLSWPANLAFIYPRWHIDPAQWWQFLYPACAAGLAIGLWVLRGRSRAPVTALALFTVMLFPALGFVNVYPFRYTFVADHFQYLASVPVIALASAAAAIVAARLIRERRIARTAVVVLIGAPLFTLTWMQSRDYADAERLYRATIARSPTSWMAHNNLALLLVARGRPAEAREELTEALRLNPDVAEQQLNMGRLLLAEGSTAEALEPLRKAVRLDPLLVSAQNNLGVALMRLGRLDEAVPPLAEAVRLQPGNAEAQANLADALHRLGRADEADRHARTALELNPDLAAAHRIAGLLAMDRHAYGEAREHFARVSALEPDSAEAAVDLGLSLQQLGRLDESVSVLGRAVRTRPADASAQYVLGVSLFRLGRIEEAAARFTEALRLDPRLPQVHNDLGAALLALGRTEEAIGHLSAAVQSQPDSADAQFNLAHALHASGRLREAVAHYAEAVRCSPDDAVIRNDFGVALVGLGRRVEAARQFTEALRLDPGLAAARASLDRLR